MLNFLLGLAAGVALGPYIIKGWKTVLYPAWKDWMDKNK